MDQPKIEKPTQKEEKKKETPAKEIEKMSELHDPGEYYLKED